MEKTITTERSIVFDFTEENFPRWEIGAKIPNPYDHVNGARYSFTGSAMVDEVLHQVGAVVSVKVTHYPAIK